MCGHAAFRWKTAVLCAVAAACLSSLSCQTPTPAESAASQTPQPTADAGVGAIGFVEPGHGLIRIAARSLGGQPSIVARLLVQEDGAVHAGQAIAELDSKKQLEAAWRQAQARIDVARSRLAQVQAGAKPSEVAAQQAEIDRISTELENAEKEHQRHVSLGQNVSSSQLDTLRLRVDTTTRALATARERLASLTEVRPVDVELAQAELAEAVRNEERARAEFEASLIYSPADGRVVKIHAWPGEQVESDGILELAPAGPMYVVAEIAESDIGRVKVGQRATIRAAALPTPLEGSVERIALKVLQNELTPIDPASFSDKRVVNAWIKVDNEAAIAQLLHLRVDVIIHP